MWVGSKLPKCTAMSLPALNSYNRYTISFGPHFFCISNCYLIDPSFTCQILDNQSLLIRFLLIFPIGILNITAYLYARNHEFLRIRDTYNEIFTYKDKSLQYYIGFIDLMLYIEGLEKITNI